MMQTNYPSSHWKLEIGAADDLRSAIDGRAGCCSSSSSSSSSLAGRALSSVTSWIHRKTADVLNDYPVQTAPDVPTRAAARFIVTIFIIVGAILTITVVYKNSLPSRTVRHWGSHYLLTLPTTQQNYPNLVCPCNKSAIPWPYYVKFYWINQTHGQSGSWNRYPIVNYTEFCDPLQLITVNKTSGLWLQGCYSMGTLLTAYTNQTQRTTVSTNTVTSPSVLAHIISTDMQDNVDEVFGEYAFLSVSSLPDWEQLLAAKQMLSRAAHRFVASTKSMEHANVTDDVYWRFFAGDFYTSPVTGARTPAMDLTGNRALVIEMNWTAYVNQCSPPYCDQVVENSLLRRLLTAMVQVGGFAAVMMVVLRGVVWPCIRHVNRWP